MLKSLFATCLTALSVNTQPLAVSPSLDSSRSIDNASASVGDIYSFDYSITDFSQNGEYELFLESDNGNDTLSLISYSIYMPNTQYSLEYINTFPTPFDFCRVNFALDITTNGYYYIFFFDTFDECAFIGEAYLVSDDLPDSLYYSFTFEVLYPITFNDDVLPFLSKLAKPYNPPVKSNLYRLLYDFYYSIFSDEDLAEISTGYNMPFDNWLAHTCTIVTLLALIVVAFFFLRWLFRVISGLILLKH